MNAPGRDVVQTITCDQLRSVARTELLDFFQLAADENVVVLTDTFDEVEERYRLAEAIASVAGELAKSEFICFPPLIQSGMDPPDNIVDAMLRADVVLIVTSRSLTHAAATMRAVENGARIGTHTKFVDSYVRAVTDASLLKSRGDKLAELLNSQPGGTLHLTTQEGTDLTVPLGSRKFLNWAGDLRRRGTVENIPAGEVLIAPPEGQSHGRIVVNLLLPSWASGTLPYVVEVREGRLVSCPEDPELLTKYKARPDRDLLCEVAFGTNHAAWKEARCLMEVEKTLGTGHVAFGSNVDFGGANQSDVHMDFVFDRVTATLNGQTLIDHGRFCFE